MAAHVQRCREQRGAKGDHEKGDQRRVVVVAGECECLKAERRDEIKGGLAGDESSGERCAVNPAPSAGEDDEHGAKRERTARRHDSQEQNAQCEMVGRKRGRARFLAGLTRAPHGCFDETPPAALRCQEQRHASPEGHTPVDGSGARGRDASWRYRPEHRGHVASATTVGCISPPPGPSGVGRPSLRDSAFCLAGGVGRIRRLPAVQPLDARRGPPRGCGAIGYLDSQALSSRVTDPDVSWAPWSFGVNTQALVISASGTKGTSRSMTSAICL